MARTSRDENILRCRQIDRSVRIGRALTPSSRIEATRRQQQRRTREFAVLLMSREEDEQRAPTSNHWRQDETARQIQRVRFWTVRAPHRPLLTNHSTPATKFEKNTGIAEFIHISSCRAMIRKGLCIDDRESQILAMTSARYSSVITRQQEVSHRKRALNNPDQICTE